MKFVRVGAVRIVNLHWVTVIDELVGEEGSLAGASVTFLDGGPVVLAGDEAEVLRKFIGEHSWSPAAEPPAPPSGGATPYGRNLLPGADVARGEGGG